MKKETNETAMQKNNIYIDKNITDAITSAISLNMPCLLQGETGTGKTSIIYHFAKLNNKNLIRINLNGNTGTEEILGKYIANEKGLTWIDGLLIHAMKTGQWIVFDEINMALPEILAVLNSLLDEDRKIILKEKEGEIINSHPDFRFFATANNSSDYAGTKDFNKALLSRFGIVLNIDYSPNESEIIKERSGIDESMIEKLLLLANDLRAAKAKNLINFSCSTRDLLFASYLIKEKISPEQAVKIAIANKANEYELDAINKIIELIFTDGEITITTDAGKKYVFQSIDEIKEKLGQISKIENEKLDWVEKYEIEKAERRFYREQAEFIDSKTTELSGMIAEFNHLINHNVKRNKLCEKIEKSFKASEFINQERRELKDKIDKMINNEIEEIEKKYNNLRNSKKPAEDSN